MSGSYQTLAEMWNRRGRLHFAEMSARLSEFHEGRTDKVDLVHDPRDEVLARDVMSAVHRLSAEGRWQEARTLFDPAHGPFIPLLEKVGQNLPCAVILGPDEFLVRTGSSYQSGEMLHLTADGIETLPGVTACAISRDHETLLLVTADGFATSRGLGGTQIAHFPWPLAASRKLDIVCVANDGKRVAFASDDFGVWVGTANTDGATWTRVHPTEELIAERRRDFGDDDYNGDDDMTHCALSSDGQFIAYGSQGSEHFLDYLDDRGAPRRWARIGNRSEYPHDACFSNDGAFAAFNSCHFYNGATIGVVVPAIEGAETAAYEDDDRVRLLNGYLRVYASTWLPADVTGTESGGFLLCGSGFATCVTPGGKVVFEQSFGSSASAVDYCPKARRMIISSYSGFLHVYDLDEPEIADRVIGFNPKRELYRWILWKDHDPVRW